MFNIVKEPLIRMDAAAGLGIAVSLPEIYAALMLDQVDAFPALRPHQRHAWHAYLVQLGALALYRAGENAPPEVASDWYELIRGLTPDFPEDEPWQLVVADITRPAFMQPPAHSKDKQSDYKGIAVTPDELDMLVTGKNHDIKSSIMVHAFSDDWIFALITRQTMEGYSGTGNHGISRMNGGFGSRPSFSITDSTRPGAHVRRDIIALLEFREKILDEYPMIDQGIGLFWTIPWDGAPAEARQLSELDPFYIEVCRRIRFQLNSEGNLYAIRASSRAARVDSKALIGRAGDSWTPVDMKGNKSLTLAAGGFNYERSVTYLLSADWSPSPLSRLSALENRSPEPSHLVARGMVRGQGKTEGYFERIILLRSKMKAIMGLPGGASELGGIARQRIDRVARIQGILRHAVAMFVAGGKADGISADHRSRANPWANRLDEMVDRDFFQDLQNEFEADAADRERVHKVWLVGVVEDARRILRDAEDALPCRSIQRYRARARADSVFEGRVRGPQGLPFLYDQEGIDR